MQWLSSRSAVPARPRNIATNNVWSSKRAARSLHNGVRDLDGISIPDVAVERFDGRTSFRGTGHVNETSSSSLSVEHGKDDAVDDSTVVAKERSQLVGSSVQRKVQNVEILVCRKAALRREATGAVRRWRVWARRRGTGSAGGCSSRRKRACAVAEGELEVMVWQRDSSFDRSEGSCRSHCLRHGGWKAGAQV